MTNKINFSGVVVRSAAQWAHVIKRILSLYNAYENSLVVLQNSITYGLIYYVDYIFLYVYKQSYNLQPEASRWIRPTAPIYVPNEEIRNPRDSAAQNIPHSSSHSHSIASMHSYRNNIEVPSDYQNLRSRSPSCYSNKMAASIGANEWTVNTNVWKVRGGH